MLPRNVSSLLIALGIFGFSMLTYAGQDPDKQGYVDWSTVAIGMASVVLTLVGGIVIHMNNQFTKLSDQLWKRLVDTEQQLESLHKTLLREYHTKEDLREMLNIMLRPIMEKLAILTNDTDAVYRELIRANKHRGDGNEHTEESHG